MPVWMQLITGLAGFILACGVIWKKLLYPFIRLVNDVEEMLPLMRDLKIAFRDSPNSFRVLNEVAAQFRTDSGSSLRDVVNRLELAANENKVAGEMLKVGVETSRQLADQDRGQLQTLLLLLDRLTIRSDVNKDSLDRIEVDRDKVAQDLAAERKEKRNE